ncbi:MAG: OmpH family outer membrane protein [Ectothiorhodospiraceae bacterium]|nr:OmpH family outer membrane protein [Ectothiorhodospiraceae bacterium]
MINRPIVTQRLLGRTLVVIIALLFSGVALAETRIGFVNLGRVSAEAPQAEAARTKLEEEFSPRDREIAAEQSDIRSLEERLSRDGAIMSEEEQRRLQRDVVSRKRELRRVQDEFREDFNMRRNEELGRLQRYIFETISGVAERNGYDLVVSDGVVYASDQVDITDLVLDRLRSDFESGNY